MSVHSAMFTLTSSLQYYVCGFLANMCGGAVYQAYSGPVLFRLAAAVALLWLGVMVVFFHLVPVFKQCRGNEELGLNDASTAVVVDVH